jgi:hypothetical protein
MEDYVKYVSRRYSIRLRDTRLTERVLLDSFIAVDVDIILFLLQTSRVEINGNLR